MEQASAASAGKPWERFRDQSTAEARQAATLAKFEALPWYGKAGQAVMDVARLGADGATFGFADKLAAGLNAEAETLTSGLDTVRAVQSALEAAGVEFLNNGRPGVRLRDRSKE